VINENTNAIKSKIRYPKNSSLVPVVKKPMIIMITKVHNPVIIICLLSMRTLISYIFIYFKHAVQALHL